jgi:hypothetical protein
MKKNTITANTNRHYERPEINIHLLSMASSILAGSLPIVNKNIYNNEENEEYEWPTDPNTSDPYSPW